MPTIDIAPGLTLTDEQYEIAHAGLLQHAPELGPLRYETWASRGWTLIPDEQSGRMYKAELTLMKTPTRTARVTLWFEPDLRDKRGPRPHNHPWDFHSMILAGSYAEDRYEVVGGDIVHTPAVEHYMGETNKIGREEYHEVVDVDPGHTLTLMLCGPGMSSWGYLNPDTGQYEQAVLPARFSELQRALNPHKA